MKILCSAGKFGGIIDKGGFNVKQLQLESGAKIHVQDASKDREESVIPVSAFEAFWNPRSQTIVTFLSFRTEQVNSVKGIFTTRILEPSNKAGCLLGQGDKL